MVSSLTFSNCRFEKKALDGPTKSVLSKTSSQLVGVSFFSSTDSLKFSAPSSLNVVSFLGLFFSSKLV